MFTYKNKKLLAQNKSLQAEHERLKTEVFLAKQHQNTVEEALTALRAEEEARKEEIQANIEILESLKKAYKEKETFYVDKATLKRERLKALRKELRQYNERELYPIFYKEDKYSNAIKRGARYV